MLWKRKNKKLMKNDDMKISFISNILKSNTMNSSKPIVKTWNKLVRDNIPTNLASKGILSHVRIISSRSELLTLLIEKGEEEAKELQVAISNLRNAEETHDITEEAADLYEVRR